MAARLAEILDRDALDASAGSRALVRVEAPADWLEAGCAIELPAPARLVCARCEGGGCDGCGRSGAFRSPPAHVLRATLPPGSAAGLAVRLVQPFGEDSVEQVLLEVRPAAQASSGLVRLVDAADEPLAKRPSRARRFVPVVLLAVLAALVGLLVFATVRTSTFLY